MPLPIVHRLVFTWNGWPTALGAATLPPPPDFASLDAAWAGDGLRRLAQRWSPTLAQMTFEVAPEVSPVFFAARVKGRIDHVLRKCGRAAEFSRKVAVRAIGHNTDPVVLRYLERQVPRGHEAGQFADARYAAVLAGFGMDNAAVDLAAPSATASGRYWYNLHLVAVTVDRWRMGREDFLPKVVAGVDAWATNCAVRVRSRALMPDHLHLAVRGPVERSPAELAEGLWRELNRAAGLRLFSDQVYVGTFSSYSTKHVLRP